MFIGNDINGNRIDISDAKESESYFCPICNAKLIQKKGDIRVHHFAHEGGSECDSWNYDMTEWHRDWQQRFPVDSREVVVERFGTKHRADILINDTVVEFQHSNISNDEFNERNRFYNRCGYDVIWLFDLQEYFADKRITVHDADNKYHWKWSSHTFDGFHPKYQRNKVNVFFQLSLADEDNYGIEYFAWKSPDPGCKYFCTGDSTYDEAYNDTEFIDLVTNKNADKKNNDNNSVDISFMAEKLSEDAHKIELRSLYSIIENSKSDVIIVRNMSGIKFSIGISGLKGRSFRSTIMGYMYRGDQREKERREIFGADQKQWILVWEKPTS